MQENFVLKKMLKTDVKIAVRSMRKNRFYSLINILGFAIGQACCIIAFFYVKEGVYIAALPALGVLLLVCLNYMNLATARPGRRAAETGLRKALGAGQNRLFREFLPEGILCSLFALLPAFVLADAFRPLFSQLGGFLIPRLYSQPELIIFILVISFAAGLAAGAYPVYYLTRMEPENVLKGRSLPYSGSGALRKFFTGFQFALAVTLLICSLYLQQQTSLKQGQQVTGFQTENIFVSAYYSIRESPARLWAELSNGAGERNPVQEVAAFYKELSAEFFSVLFTGALAGEEEGKKSRATPGAIIAAKWFLKIPGVEVYGHFFKLQNKIFKTGTIVKKEAENFLSAKENQPAPETAANGLRPSPRPLILAAKLAGIFSMITMLTACIGLSGLAAFTAEKKKKETGIRKLSGASVWETGWHFYRSYTRLIMVSVLVAVLLSVVVIYLLQPLLPQQAAVGPGIFIFSGMITLLMAWAAVGYPVYKTAMENPVTSLREIK